MTERVTSAKKHVRWTIAEFIDVLHSRYGILKSRQTINRWINSGVQDGAGNILKLRCEMIGGIRYITPRYWQEFRVVAK